MLPATFADLLAWLLTAGGLAAATTGVIAAVITGWQALTDTTLSDKWKMALAVLVPFAIVLAAWGLQGALAYVPWSIDGLYQALALAVLLVAGSQAIYVGVKQARGA